MSVSGDRHPQRISRHDDAEHAEFVAASVGSRPPAQSASGQAVPESRREPRCAELTGLRAVTV